MRRIDANRHASKTFYDRNVREVDHVPMRIADVGLHSPKSKDDVLIAFAGEVFGGVERFIEGYSKTAL